MSIQSIVVNRLLKSCKHGETPVSVAQKLCDEIPNKFMPQIEKLILSDTALDQIAGINPEVMNHGEWFTDVIEWLKGMLGYPGKYDAEFSEETIDGESEKGDLTDDPKETIILDDENADDNTDRHPIG